MATVKEIKNHIQSVEDTRKITNAMYLIASTKLRKAKKELDGTRPYFSALKDEMERIFSVSEDIQSRYLYPHAGDEELPGSYGYLVITADKGLAGAYNQTVIKKTLEMRKEHEDPKIFVVGEYGRQYFRHHNIPIEQDFLFTAQNSTISRAREISGILVNKFCRGEISKIYIIYTDMRGAAGSEAYSQVLLPFHRADFTAGSQEKYAETRFEYLPSVEKVLDEIVPTYIAGFIYSALVDSFCSEQYARMTAMDSANINAANLLDELYLKYNHIRQGAITQEITEVAAGARSMKRIAKRKKEEGGTAES